MSWVDGLSYPKYPESMKEVSNWPGMTEEGVIKPGSFETLMEVHGGNVSVVQASQDSIVIETKNPSILHNGGEKESIIPGKEERNTLTKNYYVCLQLPIPQPPFGQLMVFSEIVEKNMEEKWEKKRRERDTKIWVLFVCIGEFLYSII